MLVFRHSLTAPISLEENMGGDWERNIPAGGAHSGWQVITLTISQTRVISQVQAQAQVQVQQQQQQQQ